MNRKLALKRLTRSDLTLFEWQFHTQDAGNQKAINLNADIFVDKLFPVLPDEAISRGGKFPLDLDIFGPGEAPRLNLQRKIVKFGEYKNWRLNGEFIANPEDRPERFNVLREGDFALLEFSGLHYPESARLALVSRVADPKFHKACADFLGQAKMVALSGDELDSILSGAGVGDAYPLAGANLDAELEDASQGGIEGTRRLQRRTVTRRVSKEELRAARNSVDEIGVVGEEFVNDYLAACKRAGEIAGFVWESLNNAVAPFDFSIELSSAEGPLVDVKTTRGDFANRVHVSLNELLHMRDGERDYRIYRVYGIDGDRARLRVSDPMKPSAEKILRALESLPSGVLADGVSIDPEILSFGPPIEILQRGADEE